MTLHYDGRAFQGWQVQRDARTVQGELESAISRLTDRPTGATAAGRTDSGVHATGQVVSTDVPAGWTPVELRRALNAVLPRDVWVADAADAAPDFHARYDAVARGYVYRVGTAERAASPFQRRWCWPLARELERDILTNAAAQLVGERSFRAFAKAGQPERGDRCHVLSARWVDWNSLGVAFHVRADRFLHHMVRYLVGTMVEMAAGRRDPADLGGLLEGRAGLETSAPAPATGLFLARVYYSPDEMEREAAIDEDLP